MFLLVEKRGGEDPDFKVAEKFVYMPRDEVYSEAVRIYTNLLPKAKKYGYLDYEKMSKKGDEDNVFHFYLE